MENVRSCTQKMFAVRLLGSSVPAALAVLTGVGALVPSAVRAAQTETEPIRESRDFADDTVVDVSSAHVTLSTPASGGSTTIHVAEGHTLVLRNTRHDDANGTADWSQGHVIDATSGERLTFTGGDLRIEMPLTGEAQDNGRERAFLRAGFVSTPSQTDFENASVVLDGRGVTWGLVLAGERTSANFSQGFTMTIDRSDVPDGQSVSGILTQVGGTVTSRGDVKISLTAGVADKWMAGLQLGHAGNFESEGDVTVLLEGGKSAVPLDLYGMWVTDGDYASLAQDDEGGENARRRAPWGVAGRRRSLLGLQSSVHGAEGGLEDRRRGAARLGMVSESGRSADGKRRPGTAGHPRFRLRHAVGRKCAGRRRRCDFRPNRFLCWEGCGTLHGGRRVAHVEYSQPAFGGRVVFLRSRSFQK